MATLHSSFSCDGRRRAFAAIGSTKHSKIGGVQ